MSATYQLSNEELYTLALERCQSSLTNNTVWFNEYHNNPNEQTKNNAIFAASRVRATFDFAEHLCFTMELNIPRQLLREKDTVNRQFDELTKTRELA